jgi:Type II secretion system (T2SS), protein K
MAQPATGNPQRNQKGTGATEMRKVVNKSESGSVLILVLWVLVLLSFIAGELIGHNREKAFLAANGWESLRQGQAMESVLHLFAVPGWPIPGSEEKAGKWLRLSVDGMEVLVRVGKEARKTNLNQASDAQIRDRVIQWLGEDRFDEAEQLADAILDWRDPDDLTRTYGAEADDYEALGLDYKPSNGPFNLLTELLLVRGVTGELFWGNPVQEAEAELEADTEAETKTKTKTKAKTKTDAGDQLGTSDLEGEESSSLVEGFTIYPQQASRVSILLKGRGGGYVWALAFLETQGNRLVLRHLYRTTVAPVVEGEV